MLPVDLLCKFSRIAKQQLHCGRPLQSNGKPQKSFVQLGLTGARHVEDATTLIFRMIPEFETLVKAQ